MLKQYLLKFGCAVIMACGSVSLLAMPAIGDEITEKVLAEDGSWGYNGPHAVYSDGKLFFNYIDTDGIVWASSYDIATEDIERGKVWDTSADLHQASSIIVRPDGRLQLFVNKGGVYTHDKIFWKVSEEPGDVTEFGPLQESAEVGVAQGRQPYPLVHEESGDMYVVLNARSDERYTSLWRSTDGGNTFEEFHRMFTLAPDLRSNRSYTRSYMEGDDIHMIAVRVGWAENLDGHSIGRSEGVFYIRFNVNEHAFYKADGTKAFDLDEAPVDDTGYLDTLWHWQEDGDGEQRALWSDIVADEDGNPHVAFVVQDAVERGQSALHDGYTAVPDEKGDWRYSKVATLARGWDNSPERLNYAIAFDPDDPEIVFVAGSISEEEDTSQIYRMRTHDGGESWEREKALSGEGRLSTVVVPRVIDNGSKSVDVMWLEGRMEGWRQYNTRIMTAR